ncbi:unannotated protein [freshwater metagenome]|uniref:Unannotated protein n=1 Tax=freshwater metagenome TaxID=449393 RepID=A0A6J6M9X8_9ZZZZ|nr:hypothetical protein [Actinomycetota bacterium]MSY17394.1 hypothetical protein [Actinomycetota bacterium]MSY41039.1 hypothetical protein [Actinomycetota bacterium]
MRRRSLDQILSVTGLVLAVVLAVGGVLLMWGGNFAHSTVTNELTGQKISFSADPASLPPELAQYAGMAVTDGTGAKAYSDLIGVHVAGVADGKTYSEVSEEWIAGGRTDDALAGARTTLFMGETLRGMLLNAYAFWTIGTVALVAAWVLLGLSVVMFILTIMGFAHLRRTTEADAVFVPAA